jgi:hypothetical protein
VRAKGTPVNTALFLSMPLAFERETTPNPNVAAAVKNVNKTCFDSKSKPMWVKRAEYFDENFGRFE